MRKGYTLLEVLLVVVLVGIIFATLSVVFKVNFSSYRTTVEEKETYDNLRNIENFIVTRVRNAEELEILPSVPTTFDPDYEYIYSDGGDVYFVSKGNAPRSIIPETKEEFELVFTKEGSSERMLDIQINALKQSKRSKNTKENLTNLKTGETITGTSSNVIKFVSNLEEKVSSVSLQSFSFVESENSQLLPWYREEYVGYVDETAKEVIVEVDAEVNIKELVPHIEHTGNVATINTSEVTPGTPFDFTSTVQLQIQNTLAVPVVTETYDVIVTKKGVPRLNKFGFRQIENSFLAQDRVGSITQLLPPAVTVQVPEVRHIDDLKPYFEFKGDYIEINGTQIMAGDYSNSFDFTSPVVVTVHEYRAGSTTETMAIPYTIYVSDEPFLNNFEFQEQSTGDIYIGVIDQDALTITIPLIKGMTGSYVTNYQGDNVDLYDGLTPSGSYDYKVNIGDIANESDVMYRSDVIETADMPSQEQVVVSSGGKTKTYDIIQSGAMIKTLQYTDVNNDYLYKPIINAEIDQGDTDESRGTIKVTVPKNEYLEDMVATYTFLGTEVTADGTVQQSDVTANDIKSLSEYEVTDGTMTKKYDYELVEAPAPTIDVHSELVHEGPSADEGTLTANYDYIQGENRPQDTEHTLVTWYFTTNIDDVGKGLSEDIIHYTMNQTIDINELKPYLTDDGYIYAGVITRSEVYTVDGKTYGGVLTNKGYTDGYYLDYDPTLYIADMIWGDQIYADGSGSFEDNYDPSKTANDSVYINYPNFDGGSDRGTIHSNGNIALLGNSVKNRDIEYVKELKGSPNLSNSEQQRIYRPQPMPNYAFKIEEDLKKSIEQGKYLDVVGDGHFEITTGFANSQGKKYRWIAGNDISYGRGVNANQEMNLYAHGTISITEDVGRIGAPGSPNILYQKGEDDLIISGDIPGGIHGLIFAPNATVRISSDYFYMQGAIIAKEVIFDNPSGRAEMYPIKEINKN